MSALLFLLLLSLSTLSALRSESIPRPPSIEKQPQHEQLFQVSQTPDETDKPFTLDCEASGNPEPKFRWIKNGLPFDYVAYDKRISQTQKRGTLVFTKPDSVDEGLYQCFAENIHGTAVSNSVFLRKSELNSFADEEVHEKYAIEGQPLTLDCNPPTGYPKPAIFWIILSTSGSLRTINSSRLTVDPEGRLHFSNVTREDMINDGMYACSATSFFRTEYKIGRRVILKVESSGSTGQTSHAPVKHYVSPPNIPALRGEKLELFCIFGGTPLPDITWKKRGGIIEGNRYTYLNYGKTLQINKVNFDDAGTYECTASNGVGNQQSHAMAVTVQAAPFWKKSPNNTNAAEGESVRFECVAGGVPDPKLQWFVNGEPIEKAPPNSRRKVEGNVLTIQDLVKTDTAVYQCNASNVHGYAFKDFYINVLALPPNLIEKPEPFTRAVVTSTIALKCRVFGAPKPEVKWLRNGVELTGGRYQVLNDGDLQISNVLVTDAGEYVCYARNKFGDAIAKGELVVKKKTRITHPPINIELAAGKMAVFRCNADADTSLDLEIVWSFDGKEIDFYHNQRIVKAADNSLTISKTKELDSGVYTCTAKTELDSDSANATLIVQDVPNRPKIVNVDCGPSTAMVEWTPTGDGRAPILSYSIQYNTSFTSNVWDDAFVNIPGADNRFQVSMSPWANYTFRVIASNKIGPSLPSDPSERCSTPEAVPFKNPERVMGRGDNPHNLVISWTPMPQIEHNAPGFFYKVYWKRDDIPNSKYESKIITDWRKNKLVIENQPTFKPYRIKVEAHNKKGQAHTVATEVIGFSGEARPSQAPRNFQIRGPIEAKSALFVWDPVPDSSINGHFRGYKIQTWTADESEDRMREVTVPPNVTTALVNIFKPFSKNVVQVLAFNDMFNGPPSDIIEFNTPEGVPGPVSMLSAVRMGSSALYLVWNKPEEPNGIITGYVISYEEVSGTDLGPRIERMPVISASEMRTKLAGLKPATKYRITIQAMTSKGEGEEYYIETSTGGDDDLSPDEPKFTFTGLPDEQGKSGIRIIWLPALEGRPGSHFYVQYRRKGEEHFESTPKEENEDFTIIEGLDIGTTYEVRVVAVDGRHQTPSKTIDVYVGGKSLSVIATESTDHFAKADWLIGMLCAIALVIILAIIVCIIKRNRGGKYFVHEKEAAQGGEMDYGDEGGFNEYSKQIEPRIPARVGSRTSLTGSLRHPDGNDTDSMTDFGEDDSSKFGEDGSFIGQYGSKKKNAVPQSPMGVATFV
ncbi:neuronal cell adhesion molecule-like protein [Dinothrombium tinctorium]|uniref:Neuronal cell adhesion molecule-like protein n=2 Tax=Dinothrombium tinctorium TaxID=1965070 RepID=A0A3S4QPL0_9ACAR|nr:neuronal cell adhesion molecule-like protein [Dinothrombium tinctorium]